jgi:hypothetical protein
MPERRRQASPLKSLAESNASGAGVCIRRTFTRKAARCCFAATGMRAEAQGSQQSIGIAAATTNVMHRSRAARREKIKPGDGPHPQPGAAQIRDTHPLVLRQVPRRNHRRPRADHGSIVHLRPPQPVIVRPSRQRFPVFRCTPTIRHASALLTPRAISRANCSRLNA